MKEFTMETEYELECIVNDAAVKTRVSPGMVLLDFLRRHEHLTGTKEGCREGDCGACTVLLGELRGDTVVYKTVNSCLLPVGDVDGKHVVTIEGLNQTSGLNPVQQALVDEVGTQCGFCTPGFVISLTGCCIDLAAKEKDSVVRRTDMLRDSRTFERHADEAVDGNLCRCTGHIPIKNAIRRIGEYLSNNARADGTLLSSLVGQSILPEYFLGIAPRLAQMLNKTGTKNQDEVVADPAPITVSGGTDLYVQKAFTMHAMPARRIAAWQRSVGITEDGSSISIPATTTVEEFRISPVIGKYFPGLATQLLMFGSSPIRHRATIAGNIANASPIGDMTCILTALDAGIVLIAGESKRTIPLRKLYSGYKRLDKKPEELIGTIILSVLGRANGREHHLSYEKVSRRQYLDIASVNSAMSFHLEDGVMQDVAIAAGGVGPTMLHLARTSAIMSSARMDVEVLARALEEAQREISPISDARGSAGYKRLLLRQLIAAHVMKFFPHAVEKEALV